MTTMSYAWVTLTALPPSRADPRGSRSPQPLEADRNSPSGRAFGGPRSRGARAAGGRFAASRGTGHDALDPIGRSDGRSETRGSTRGSEAAWRAGVAGALGGRRWPA